LSVCVALVSAQEKPAGGIQWAKDLASGMAQSAADGRPVITYFTFDT
jgi:hypothetical protein